VSTVDNLLRDLLDWLSTRDRTYAEVMDAWRTSCPRLPVWEEANERGLVTKVSVGDDTIVRLTALGSCYLHEAMAGD
jgi:hypothetical protein